MSRRAWRPAETPGTPPALTPSERPHHSHGRAHPADLLRNLRFSSEAACPRQHPGMQTTHARRVSLLGPVWPKRRNVKSSRKIYIAGRPAVFCLDATEGRQREGCGRRFFDSGSAKRGRRGGDGLHDPPFWTAGGTFPDTRAKRGCHDADAMRTRGSNLHPTALPAALGSRRTRRPKSPRSRRCTRGRPRRAPTPSTVRPDRLPRRTP